MIKMGLDFSMAGVLVWLLVLIRTGVVGFGSSGSRVLGRVCRGVLVPSVNVQNGNRWLVD